MDEANASSDAVSPTIGADGTEDVAVEVGLAVVGDAELAAAPSDSERTAEQGIGGPLEDAPGEAELAVRDGEDGPSPEAPDAWDSCTPGM